MIYYLLSFPQLQRGGFFDLSITTQKLILSLQEKPKKGKLLHLAFQLDILKNILLKIEFLPVFFFSFGRQK